jgi:radical SAM PhpK family P-methyltransferase
MKETIDCFFIGHNEMDFTVYEETIQKMGADSGAYRDLRLNYLNYEDKPYPASEVFNLFCAGRHSSGKTITPLQQGETFSAAIAYLGTYLHKRGYTFDFINSFQEERDKLADKLMQEDILTIGITTTLYVSPFPIIEIVNYIRKFNQTSKIIIGGPFVSTQFRTQEPMVYKYLLESLIGADIYINSSQGEATLVNILKALKEDLPLEQIPNIYYKTTKGYVSNPILRENNQLSENMVNWDLFSNDVGEYLNVRTSISCPFSCAFCGFPQHAGPFQTADVDQIEGELNLIEKLKKVKSINFIDDTFNIPVKRYKEILRMMIKNDFSFKWHAHFRCQFADREMIELMKQSGCEGVFLGIESGNNQILENMNKSVTTDKYLEGIELLKEYEVPTFGSFIIGFPGETNETIQDTITFIKESDLDFFHAQLWYCEPLTPIWKQREKYNIKGSHYEWSHYTMQSKNAANIIEEIYLNNNMYNWVPQYNFDFDMLFRLTNRGLTLNQVKRFIKCFNIGIKEKLREPTRKNISPELMNKFKHSICNG